MPYIYKITNDINGKSYIGKTMLSIQERWEKHLHDARTSRCEKRPLYAAINKYGKEHFIIEQIEECSDIILSEREKYWIEYYGTFKNGYNATTGGDGRSYIDYDLVVANYTQLQNIESVASLMNIHRDSVTNILKARKIPIKSSQMINREQNGKIVQMFDKKTGIFIQSFSTTADAARWLIDNNYTNCKYTTIRYHISEVCAGKRKSAAGFIWKYPSEK